MGKIVRGAEQTVSMHGQAAFPALTLSRLSHKQKHTKGRLLHRMYLVGTAENT